MDPEPQEPTFQTTLTDVRELRAHFAEKDNDWPKYKMVVVNTVRSGVAMEQRLRNLEETFENKLARRTAVDVLIRKIDKLTDAAERRRGFLGWLLRHLWQLIILATTAYVAHRWH